MIFRCTKAMTIVLFSIILEFERFHHSSERFWLVFFFKSIFCFFRFIADLNLIIKVQLFVYIMKKGFCEIPNSNPFWQLKIYMLCNGLSTFTRTMAFVIIFEVYVDWIDWELRNFGEIVGNFWGLCCGLGSEFPKHVAFQSEPINKYRSINDFLMLFNKPSHFHRFYTRMAHSTNGKYL